jgi:hypothetical protein
MSLNTNPTIVAADLAAQLRADPIAASQIIQHIPSSELLDLLNLRVAMAQDIAEQIDHAVCETDGENERLRYYIEELETEIAELRANR